MADNEISASPSIAGRVVEGVKSGVVGLAIGAATGAVTGGAITALGFDEEAAKIAAETLTPAQNTELDYIGRTAFESSLGDNAAEEFTKAAKIENLNQIFQEQVLVGAEAGALVGGIAGGTYNGLSGLVSSQSDKRQDMVDSIQAQQIAGVGQLAGMSLAATQELQHENAALKQQVEVLGKFTQKIANERASRGQDNLSLGA